MTFKFDLGQRATITESQEQGEIIARAEFAYGESQYLLRHKAGDGRCVDCWWGESALQ